MAQTPDEAFEIFCNHWSTRSVDYSMDDPLVREKFMSLMASTMVLLKESPESFDKFIALAARSMETVMPDEVKQRIYDAVQRQGL